VDYIDKDFLVDCLKKGMSTRDIEKVCDKKRSNIAYWIKKYGIGDMMHYKKEANYSFSTIDTRDKAYALGFILADAAIHEYGSIEVSVAIRDKEVVEYISGVIGGRVNYCYTLDKKSRRFPRARLQKKITDIKKFTGGTSKNERHYPRVRHDLERYLLQGLFDADGCITWGRRKDKNRIWQKVSFTSQYSILIGVQKYLSKIGISSSIHPKGTESCFVLEFANRNDVVRFCDHIYPNDEFIILNRKYLKYKALRLELEENGEGAMKQ
jgi:hypothetical protein